MPTAYARGFFAHSSVLADNFFREFISILIKKREVYRPPLITMISKKSLIVCCGRVTRSGRI